jgi:Tfp pilus assembly protein PilF
MPKAKAAAIKALHIDDKLAEAHTSLGGVTAGYDWNWFDAEREFKRAIELNPNHATAHQWYAEYLAGTGRYQEAIAEIKRAHDLDPLSLIINSDVGWILYFARQYKQAEEQYRKTLEMEPNFTPARLMLALVYEQEGLYDRAIAEYQELQTRFGETPDGILAAIRALTLSNGRREAQQMLEELTELSKRRYVRSYFIAGLYTGLGNVDQAFAWLQRAYEERDDFLMYLKADPMLDSLRSDPRFERLLQRIGFPP